MKKILLFVGVMGFALYTFAQELPKPSPHAKIEQRIGLTDVSVEYSRPKKNDREIFGALVPYGQLWRTGANLATNFTTSSDIEINGEKLAAGSYSFFVTPSENEKWEIAFNTDTKLWGNSGYDESKTVLTSYGMVETLDHSIESMEFRFMDVSMDGKAKLALEWENKRIVIDLYANPEKQAMANINKAIEESKEEDLWRVYRSAASYANDAHLTDDGLKWIQQSVELKDSWYSYWVYAELLAQNGDYKGAIEKAQKSLDLGNADSKKEGREFPYASDLENDINKWGAMN